MADIAVQLDDKPTNKLAVGTSASAGVGALFAGIFASYGNDALRGVLLELLPFMSSRPQSLDFLIFVIVTAAGWWLTKKSGVTAAYNVMDKPNEALIPASRTANKMSTVQPAG